MKQWDWHEIVQREEYAALNTLGAVVHDLCAGRLGDPRVRARLANLSRWFAWIAEQRIVLVRAEKTVAKECEGLAKGALRTNRAIGSKWRKKEMRSHGQL